MSGVILYPLFTEKALMQMEKNNTIIFIVNVKANRKQIKDEVEKLFGVKVVKVNTLIDMRGRKKAYVKLAPEHSALELATRLGIL